MALRSRIVPLVVASPLFLQNVDSSAMATALPSIASSLNVDVLHLNLAITAYLLSLAVFLPLSGWVAERFGAKRVFCTAIAMFSLGSALCGMADSLASLVLYRILQGLGGAMMLPVGRLILLRSVPATQLIAAMVWFTVPPVIGRMLGPLLGGAIVTWTSWRWIFLLNVPLGLAAMVAAWALIRSGEAKRPPFDSVGFILTGLGIGLSLAGVEGLSRSDLSRGISFGMLFAGVAALLLSSVHLRRAAHPLFGLEPLKIATFRVTVLGGSLFRTTISSAPFLLPLMFQLALGYSAVQAGALLLWLFVGNLCMKPATSWIMNRFGFRNVLIGNGLLVAAGFAACSFLTAETPYWMVCALLMATGMTRSMQFTAMNTIGFSDVPQPQMRDATTLFSVMQQMNAGMGIAVGALALSVAEILNGSAAGMATTQDFQLAFWFVAGLALLAIVDSLLLPAGAGARVLKAR